MSQFIVLAPILTLVALGAVITLRSGAVNINSRSGLRVMAGNFWAMLIRVACYLAGLLMLEQILGTPSLLTLN